MITRAMLLFYLFIFLLALERTRSIQTNVLQQNIVNNFKFYIICWQVGACRCCECSGVASVRVSEWPRGRKGVGRTLLPGFVWLGWNTNGYCDGDVTRPRGAAA